MSFGFHHLTNSALPTRSRAEFVKFFGGILVQTMKAKRHFEINWSLICILNIFYETFCWLLMRKLYSVWCRKVTTILIFVLCVHKKIWVCHKTSSMSNLNNVYARSLQHVKFGRTPCNFIFMRNHVFFSFLRCCCCCCFPLSDNNNRFISLYGHSCEPYIISRRTRRKRGNFLCC